MTDSVLDFMLLESRISGSVGAVLVMLAEPEEPELSLDVVSLTILISCLLGDRRKKLTGRER